MSNQPLDNPRPAWWAEARRLRAEGLAPKEIGAILGKNPKLISSVTAGYGKRLVRPASPIMLTPPPREVIVEVSPDPTILAAIRQRKLDGHKVISAKRREWYRKREKEFEVHETR